MAETAAVSLAELDPTYVTALTDAIEAAWSSVHTSTGGDVAMLFPVCTELMARVLAGLYDAGEHVDLQAVIGHLYSRAQQITAQSGPLTTRRERN